MRGAGAVLTAGGVVIIGEAHGTEESPAVFAELVCIAAAKRLAIRVGLELTTSDVASLPSYLASDGGSDARAALRASRVFKGADDGRSSVAMFAMIERLRVLVQRGARVQLFPFKGPRGDSDMAREIAAVHAAAPTDLVLVLVGANHARIDQDSEWDEPLGWQLRRRGVALIAVDTTHVGGTAWNLTSDGFGAHAYEATAKPGPAPAVRMGGIAGYDGELFVGRLHGSPPAPVAEPSEK